MSYKTLAKDIAENIRSDIQNGIISSRSDLDKTIIEYSEEMFKPLAAREYLEENNLSAGKTSDCFAAYNYLVDSIYSELEDLDIDRILYSY